MENFGPPQVRALTLASRVFFEQPPAWFSDHLLLSPRGAMIVAATDRAARLEEHWDVLRSISPTAQRLNGAQARALVPVQRADRALGALGALHDSSLYRYPAWIAPAGR